MPTSRRGLPAAQRRRRGPRARRGEAAGRHGLLFLGEAATLEETSTELAITFAIALLVVFLVLVAQFESLTSAGVVMLTVPFGMAAAVFALCLTGTTINIYSQIGILVLIGIMAKNGILMVEFADQLRDRGRSVRRGGPRGFARPPAPDRHDHGLDRARRAAADPQRRPGLGIARRDRLGDLRRARPRRGVHLVPDARGLCADCLALAGRAPRRR